MPNFSLFLTRSIVAFLAIIATSLGSTAKAQQVIRLDQVADPTAKACLAQVGPQLEKANGRLTPEVRAAYVDWAWRWVLAQLQAQNQFVAADCIAEVDADQELKDAVSASVYPPDPSILQNYASIRKNLGSAFIKKYRSLSIGVALARRTKGVIVGSNDGVGRENQVPIWAYRPLFTPANEEEGQGITHIAAYLKTTGKTALELFESADEQRRLAVFLKSKGVSDGFIGGIGQNQPFGEKLKNAMIVLQQRPAGRSPAPPFITWLKYLTRIFEVRPETTPSIGDRPLPWPLLDHPTVPWPLLMPLSHPVPLDEAEYLWEAFKGEHGPDRFHTYGPYRDDLTAMPDMLRPSKWYWSAVPDQIVHGGQCMPISLATIDLYASLGKPAMGAAQPGHANLITFTKDGLAWRADIEQDFAGGARVTFSQWFFDDPARGDLHFRDLFGWPGAEYHIGLAAAMNLSLRLYVDTRIAARIFDILPKEAQSKIGRTLLVEAATLNPFNPEVWYRLAAMNSTSSDSVKLVQALRHHNPKSLLDSAPSSALAAFMDSGNAGPAQASMEVYWSVLQEFVARSAVLGRPAPKDEAGLHEAYLCLAQTPGIDAGELLAYTQRFVGFQGDAWLKEQVSYDQELAEKDDRFGCLRMGQRHIEGDGVPRDESKARTYLTRAVKLGESAAGMLLASMSVPLPLDGVELVPSSTYSPTQDIRHLIDGSGISNGLHDNSVPAATMWQTADNAPLSTPAEGLPPSPAWVRFNFPQPRTFDAVEIWNHNQVNLTDRGFRNLKIYGSADGKKWTVLAAVTGLARASGVGWEPATTVMLANPARMVRNVILAADAKDGNYGSACYGLSEVRFVCRPVARAVPAHQIQVRASSQFSDTQSVNHLIDGSGLIGELHDNQVAAATMWQTVENPPLTTPDPGLPKSPAWVRFNFSMPRYLEEIAVWNHNQANLTDRGFRKMRIYGTSDGVEWFPLTATPDVYLPRASGASGSVCTTYFNVFPERPLRSVVIMADPFEGNFGSKCYGLSAVRFIMPGEAKGPVK